MLSYGYLQGRSSKIIITINFNYTKLSQYIFNTLYFHYIQFYPVYRISKYSNFIAFHLTSRFPRKHPCLSLAGKLNKDGFIIYTYIFGIHSIFIYFYIQRKNYKFLTM